MARSWMILMAGNLRLQSRLRLQELTCFNLTGKMTSILFVVWISFLILQVVKIND
ncbi:hypothetical protein IC582_013151 [Cucumis melo]